MLSVSPHLILVRCWFVLEAYPISNLTSCMVTGKLAARHVEVHVIRVEFKLLYLSKP